MKLFKQLSLAALLALSLAPAVHAEVGDFDDLGDLDDLVPTWFAADANNDDLMPTW